MAEKYKFAHISDCHLGAFREELLRSISTQSFQKAIDLCIENKVDFIVISGDLFHIHVPDMSIVVDAAKSMRKAKDEGIEIYLIYGSHDYSITEKSIIDVLSSAGLVKKVFSPKYDKNDKIILEFTVDKKTNAKITGISGRKRGLEKTYFKNLNLKHLEKEKGFKIFVFHSAITEFKPDFFSEMDSIPLSHFPKKFNYYAAGHVHSTFEKEVKNYGHVMFPGPLFGSSLTDLEKLENKKPGFFIVEFDGKKVTKRKFIELDLAKILVLKYNADNKTSIKAEEELVKLAEGSDVEGKIVLFKIKGELASGKVSDIDFQKIKETLITNGAALVKINKSLKTHEIQKIFVQGETKEEIEMKLFKEQIARLEIKEKKLLDENGIKISLELLKILRKGRGPETVTEYNNRILKATSELLKFGDSK